MIYTLGTKKFSENLKSLNFITLKLNVLKFLNITKAGVKKKVDHNPISSTNYAAFYNQTLEEVPGPLLPEKFKIMRIANIFKNCLNS